MFDWMRRYNKVEYLDHPNPLELERMHRFIPTEKPAPNGVIRPQTIHSMETEEPPELQERLTEIAIWFTAMVVWGAADSLAFPASSESAVRLIMEQAAPCFRNVRRLGGPGSGQILLQKINPEIPGMLERSSSGLLEVVKDLYRQPSKNKTEPAATSLLTYTLDMEKFDPIAAEGQAELRTLLQEMYFDAGETCLLTPSGWQLEEALSLSPALRFLAGIAKEIQLLANGATGEILVIALSGAAVKRSILRGSARAGSVRIHKECLYFHTGGGMVYVANLRGQLPVRCLAEIQDGAYYLMNLSQTFEEFDPACCRRIPGTVSIAVSGEASLLRRLNHEIERRLGTERTAD
ncbi:hypothetical protein ACE6ED_17835 [Paenibacillus sp. CN-4]|uniref:hypothetical protein n=1 Tax=Paenibacillus nanchangensis TaxID=3348343 RepID=UPI00397A3013